MYPTSKLYSAIINPPAEGERVLVVLDRNNSFFGCIVDIAKREGDMWVNFNWNRDIPIDPNDLWAELKI